MRKHFTFVFLLLCVFAASVFVSAENRDQPVMGSGTFYMPENLLIIDDEAFSGTSVSRIIMQSHLTIINDGAFSGNQFLKEVFIPVSVTIIADNAFEDSDGVVIWGAAGSYAENWAHRNGIPFLALDSLEPGVKRNLTSRSAINIGHNEAIPDLYDYLLLKKSWKYSDRHSTRPQDRIDLRVLDYWFP